jgi:hypothetical protein
MRVLAMVYRARGETDLAKKTLQRAMLMFPNNEALAADMRGEAEPALAPPAKAAASKPEKPVTTASNKPAPAPPSKPATTVAELPPAAKPEPVKAKPPVDAVVIPPLAFGGLTLGAAVGDLLAFDALPGVAIAKTVEAAPVAKAVVSAKPPAKPAETSAPPAAPKPVPPVPTISIASIPALAFGGLTLGAAFSDLVALEKLPTPPAEVVAPPPAPPPPATASVPDSPVVIPAPVLAPKPSTKASAIDLHWGKIPLWTISPAFVYGDVPPPRP